MQASKRHSLSVEAQEGTGVQREHEWFIVVAELDDGLLTFQDFETMANDDPRHVCARLIRGLRTAPSPGSADR